MATITVPVTKAPASQKQRSWLDESLGAHVRFLNIAGILHAVIGRRHCNPQHFVARLRQLGLVAGEVVDPKNPDQS